MAYIFNNSAHIHQVPTLGVSLRGGGAREAAEDKPWSLFRQSTVLPGLCCGNKELQTSGVEHSRRLLPACTICPHGSSALVIEGLRLASH